MAHIKYLSTYLFILTSIEENLLAFIFEFWDIFVSAPV